MRRLLEEHEYVLQSLLGAEVWGRTGRRAQGKQGSQKKGWGEVVI
jgi:hypothetical protein